MTYEKSNEVISSHDVYRTNESSSSSLASVVSTKNATVTRKLQKVLDITLDESFRESLDYLSAFYVQNTNKDRKNLRGCLEQRSLSLHQTFLGEFSKVNQKFLDVKNDVDDLSNVCEKASETLQHTQQEASALLSSAQCLKEELKAIKEKEIQMNSFLKRFQLTQEEKDILNGDINDIFFEVLRKVENIHKSCKELLNAQYQQAGIEIMEEMYTYQLSGFERLFTYAHKACLEFMFVDSPEMVSTTLLNALGVLKGRPALWMQCLHEVAKGRKTAIARRFNDALTHGPRPIELHINDPVRYVGDILAYIHQAVAEESEFIQQFFNPAQSAYISTISNVVGEESVSKSELLDLCFEGLCKHLKVRVDHLLSSIPSSQPDNLVMVVLFKLGNVIEFYAKAFLSALQEGNCISALLVELKNEMNIQLFEYIKRMSASLMELSLDIPSNFAAPTVVFDIMDKLTAMMDTLSTSLVSSPVSDLYLITSAVVDPLIKYFATSINVLADQKGAYEIFMINSVYTIQTSLSSYSFNSTKTDELTTMITKWIDEFVKEQVMTIVHLYAPSEKETCALEDLQKFSTYMNSFDSKGSIAYVDNLISIRLREQTKRNVYIGVFEIYEKLYNASAEKVDLIAPNQLKLKFEV